MLAIGDVLTREDGRRYKLVGIDSDGSWVGEPLDAFGPPESLDARLLASGFGVEGDTRAPEDAGHKPGTLPVDPHTDGWEALARQSRIAANIAAAGAGDLVPGMDTNTSTLGDAHESGAIRPADIEGDSEEGRKYVAALRHVARKLRREVEPTPEDAFKAAEDADLDAKRAQKRAEAEAADLGGKVSRTRKR